MEGQNLYPNYQEEKKLVIEKLNNLYMIPCYSIYKLTFEQRVFLGSRGHDV